MENAPSMVQNTQPTNRQNAAAIAQHDPRIGMAMMDREAERQQQQMAQAQSSKNDSCKSSSGLIASPTREAFQRGLNPRNPVCRSMVFRAPMQKQRKAAAKQRGDGADIPQRPSQGFGIDMQRAMELTRLPASDPKTIEVPHGCKNRPLSVEAGGEAWVIDPLTGTRQIVAANPGGVTPGAPVGDIPRVTSPDEARRLPPGTRFIDPNGIERIVPGGGGGNATGPFPSAGN